MVGNVESGMMKGWGLFWGKVGSGTRRRPGIVLGGALVGCGSLRGAEGIISSHSGRPGSIRGLLYGTRWHGMAWPGLKWQSGTGCRLRDLRTVGHVWDVCMCNMDFLPTGSGPSRSILST